MVNFSSEESYIDIIIPALAGKIATMRLLNGTETNVRIQEDGRLQYNIPAGYSLHSIDVEGTDILRTEVSSITMPIPERAQDAILQQELNSFDQYTDEEMEDIFRNPKKYRAKNKIKKFKDEEEVW